MAHNLEIRGGKASFFAVGKPAWHGLGTIVQDAPTIPQALELAGLDWKVSLHSVFDKEGNALDKMAKLVVRNLDGQQFGVVGPRWQPLQNRTAFEWFQPFLDSKEAELHTAGALNGGRRVWILARICGKPLEIVKDDTVERFLLLSNSHDGTLAVRVGFTPIRVVCANTLAVAHNATDSQLIRFKHGQSLVANLESIRDTISLANRTFEATAEQFRILARKSINKADLRKYLKIVYGFNGDTPEDEISTRQKNVFDKITENFEQGFGHDIKANGKTYWRAYNAVTEYLTYARPEIDSGKRRRTADDSRLDSLWFGANSRLNTAALDAAIALAV